MQAVEPRQNVQNKADQECATTQGHPNITRDFAFRQYHDMCIVITPRYCRMAQRK